MFKIPVYLCFGFKSDTVTVPAAVVALIVESVIDD